MSTASLALEAQVWSVMESLAKAAAAEICSLVDSQCVEMRLEIRRGQTEIESLKGKLRELRKALREKSTSTVSQINPQLGESERDMSTDDLYQEADFEEKEEDKKTSSSGLMNLQEDSIQDDLNSHLNCGINQFTQFTQSQILSDSLNSKGKADSGGLNTAAVKVEAGSFSVSTAECIYENSQNDQELSPDTEGPVMGDEDHPFGRIEEFHPQPHYSVQSHQPEEASSCKYDAIFSQMNEPRNAEGSPSRVEFKTEPQDQPIAERTNELAPCEMTDSDALPWPFLTAENFETQGCSSRLQQILHASQTDSQLFHLAGTSDQSLPSCSIKQAVDHQVKHAKAKKIQDRIQVRNFKQSSGSWSAMLTKVKNLPKTSTHKLLPCSFCPKSFNNASDLKRHQRIHTGERPFGCTVCGKRFALRGNLITHERGHSGSKPYTCQQCGKSFAHGSNLTAHQRVHTGEKPFCCSLCGKTFAWHYPFKRHMALHGQNGPIPGL